VIKGEHCFWLLPTYS